MVFDVDRISHLKLKALSWILWFSRSSVHLCSADRGDRVASDGASSVLVPSPDPESPPNVVDSIGPTTQCFCGRFSATNHQLERAIHSHRGSRRTGSRRPPRPRRPIWVLHKDLLRVGEPEQGGGMRPSGTDPSAR